LSGLFHQPRKPILAVFKGGHLRGEFNLFFREVHDAETGLILRALILIFAGRFRFLTTRFLTTRFLTTRFLTTRFFTTRFFTTRFFTARFFTTRFFTARFFTTRFFTAKTRFMVAAMRIIAARRTRMERRLLLRLARRLDAAEHAAEFVQLAFVRQLLAIGNLDEFENAIKFVGHLLERLGNLRGVLDGLADGRGLGGTKIGGLDPRLGTGRFRALFA
jgi:hypothetical protein